MSSTPVYSRIGDNDVNATPKLDMRDPCAQKRQVPAKGGPTHHAGDWPIRPADKMDNVKPRLYMKKKHEEEKRENSMATSKCIMLANAMARLSVELRAVEELQHRFPLSPDGESVFAEKIREIKEEMSYFDTLLYENHCFGSKEQPSKAKEGRST